MNSNRILKIAGAVVVAIILLYSFLPSGLSYQDKIAQHRADTNDFMKNHADSPLPDSAKANFSGLKFFDLDPEYKVNATLETIPGNPEVTMATSDGETRTYRKFAYAYFELGGDENRLTLLQPVDDQETLFLPFGDLTNGEETYGGGRYLDLSATGQRNIIIDFNLAYNPYCVFSADYSCPLPPVENQLSIAVRSGEMYYDNLD
jgi:uncharacterized protein (DUF1684 family)